MPLLSQAVGAAIVLLTLLDVFFTVLFPASGHGPIRNPLAWAVWRCFRLIGSVITGQRRRNFLSYSGPVLFTVTFIVWFLLLVIGWAMIYKPALGTAITVSSGPTSRDWATAIYYSGFNVTTLGIGDVAANTGLYRLLTITESAQGGAFFGMVITYFLSVYSQLTSRNAFAQGLHNLTGRTGSAVELLARVAHGAELETVGQHFSSKAEFLRQIYQTHRFYPILRYFRYREPQYALPRILLIALDAATLVRSGLDRERYARLLRSPVIEDLSDSAMSLMLELSGSAPCKTVPASEAEAWRHYYNAALARLSEVGVTVRGDRETGAEEYVMLRAQWDGLLRKLADFMLDEWEVVEPRSAAPEHHADRSRSSYP